MDCIKKNAVDIGKPWQVIALLSRWTWMNYVYQIYTKIIIKEVESINMFYIYTYQVEVEHIGLYLYYILIHIKYIKCRITQSTLYVKTNAYIKLLWH